MVILAIFTSCELEPDSDMLSGVYSVMIVNRSDTVLHIDSVEYFESVGRPELGWGNGNGQFVGKKVVDKEVSPTHSIIIEIPYEHEYGMSQPIWVAKLNCTYGENLFPVVGEGGDWNNAEADYPLLSEKYLLLENGSSKLEFKSYQNSDLEVVYSLVYTL